MVATNSTPIEQAHAALDGLSDAQRVAFCILTVNKITDPSTAFQLTRLSLVSRDTAHELVDAAIDRKWVL